MLLVGIIDQPAQHFFGFANVVGLAEEGNLPRRMARYVAEFWLPPTAVLPLPPARAMSLPTRTVRRLLKSWRRTATFRSVREPELLV